MAPKTLRQQRVKTKNRALCVSGEGMCPPNVTQGLVPLTILQYRNTIKMQRVKRVNNISYFVPIFWIHKSASLNLLDTFAHTCLCQVTHFGNTDDMFSVEHRQCLPRFTQLHVFTFFPVRMLQTYLCSNDERQREEKEWGAKKNESIFHHPYKLQEL